MTRGYASSLGRKRHRAALSGICDGTGTSAAPVSAPRNGELSLIPRFAIAKLSK
jgi:hypothetical protein